MQLLMCSLDTHVKLLYILTDFQVSERLRQGYLKDYLHSRFHHKLHHNYQITTKSKLLLGI